MNLQLSFSLEFWEFDALNVNKAIIKVLKHRFYLLSVILFISGLGIEANGFLKPSIACPWFLLP